MSKDKKKSGEEKPTKPVINTQTVRENLTHQPTNPKGKEKN